MFDISDISKPVCLFGSHIGDGDADAFYVYDFEFWSDEILIFLIIDSQTRAFVAEFWDISSTKVVRKLHLPRVCFDLLRLDKPLLFFGSWLDTVIHCYECKIAGSQFGMVLQSWIRKECIPDVPTDVADLVYCFV